MSEYWMGYHCDGLYLTWEEVYALGEKLAEYVKEHREALDVLSDEITEKEFWQEDGTFDKEGWTDFWADNIVAGRDGIKLNGKTIEFVSVTEDNSDGAFITQYIGETKDQEIPYNAIYILPLDRRRPDPFKAQYKDAEEMLMEVKGKLADFLPENFPWEERLGHLRYAMYA